MIEQLGIRSQFFQLEKKVVWKLQKEWEQTFLGENSPHLRWDTDEDFLVVLNSAKHQWIVGEAALNSLQARLVSHVCVLLFDTTGQGRCWSGCGEAIDTEIVMSSLRSAIDGVAYQRCVVLCDAQMNWTCVFSVSTKSPCCMDARTKSARLDWS